MGNTYFVDIEKLSPTHFYLSQKKLNDAQKHFETHSLEDYPPLPVIKFKDKTLLLKGHHFAYYIATRGKLIAKVYEADDKSDFFLNVKLLGECEKKNITHILDLKKRIVSDDEYSDKWSSKYEEMKYKSDNNPVQGIKCELVTDKSAKTASAKKILTPIPQYFANEFIYNTYIDKVADMDFISFNLSGHMIAFAALRPLYENMLEIYMLGISEGAQAQALSQKIIKEIKGHAKKLGKEYITVKVPMKTAVQNNASRLYDFYLSFGFSHIENLESPWDEKRLCMLLVTH